MSGWRLYEVDDFLRDAIAAAESVIDPETGEIPEDWAAFLDEVQMSRDKKALSVACYVRELVAEAEAIKAEKDRLARRQKVVENIAQRVKDRIAMFVAPGEKLKDARVSIGWLRSDSVNVTASIDTLPAEYVRVIPETREPDRVALKKAIKAGATIEGVELVERQSIQIR